MNHWLIFQPCLIAPEGILGIKYPIKSLMIPWWPLFTNLPLFSRYIPWKSWNTSNNNSLRVYSMVFHDFHVYSWYILVYNTIFQWSPTAFCSSLQDLQASVTAMEKGGDQTWWSCSCHMLTLANPPQKKTKNVQWSSQLYHDISWLYPINPL